MLPKKVNNGGKKRGRRASPSTESSPAGDQEPTPPETTEVEQGSGTERPAADTDADDTRPATRRRREQAAAATPEVAALRSKLPGVRTLLRHHVVHCVPGQMASI